MRPSAFSCFCFCFVKRSLYSALYDFPDFTIYTILIKLKLERSLCTGTFCSLVCDASPCSNGPAACLDIYSSRSDGHDPNPILNYSQPSKNQNKMLRILKAASFSKHLGRNGPRDRGRILWYARGRKFSFLWYRQSACIRPPSLRTLAVGSIQRQPLLRGVHSLSDRTTRCRFSDNSASGWSLGLVLLDCSDEYPAIGQGVSHSRH